MSFIVADSTTPSAQLKQLVELHLQSLPELFLSRLGDYFVTRFYEELRTDGEALLGLWLDNERVVGVAAGGHRLGHVFDRIPRRRFQFVTQMINRLATEPSLLPQLLRSRTGVRKEDAGVVELTYFAVSPALRGRGIGTKLMAEFSDWWSARGYHKLCLNVESENDTALRFYLKEGFETMEEVTQGSYRRKLLVKSI